MRLFIFFLFIGYCISINPSYLFPHSFPPILLENDQIVRKTGTMMIANKIIENNNYKKNNIIFGNSDKKTRSYLKNVIKFHGENVRIIRNQIFISSFFKKKVDNVFVINDKNTLEIAKNCIKEKIPRLIILDIDYNFENEIKILYNKCKDIDFTIIKSKELKNTNPVGIFGLRINQENKKNYVSRKDMANVMYHSSNHNTTKRKNFDIDSNQLYPRNDVSLCSIIRTLIHERKESRLLKYSEQFSKLV